MTYEYRIEYRGPERTEGGIPDKARIDVKETYRATDVVGIACTVRLYIGEERMARVTIAWMLRDMAANAAWQSRTATWPRGLWTCYGGNDEAKALTVFGALIVGGKSK